MVTGDDRRGSKMARRAEGGKEERTPRGLDAGEAARWMLHCHHMPHLFTGMMTEFAVTA